MAKEPRYQGAGSSHINPYRLASACGAAPEVRYAEDVSEAKDARVCVVFAGLTDDYESEGFDREDMKMPPEQNALIDAVAAANGNTVVVLSCTSFEYSDLRIDGMRVSFTVKNTGSVAGKEIAELYIEPPRGEFCRTARELRGFKKVYLEPGGEIVVSFELTDRAFALWNGGWQIPGGEYGVLVAASSEDVRLRGSEGAGVVP